MAEHQGLNLLDVERWRLSPGNIRKIRANMNHFSVDLCESLGLCRLRSSNGMISGVVCVSHV
jgi:hypothetical protein